MTFKKIVEVEMALTPEELAKSFWSMDNQQQAAFFNALYLEVGGSLGAQQWEFIGDDMTPNACMVLRAMAEAVLP